MGRCTTAMRHCPHDQKSKSEVNSHDVIKWKSEACVRRSRWLQQIFKPNLAQNTNATLSTRRNVQIHINWKYIMAAAAILNFGKISITSDWIRYLHQFMWEDAPRPCGDDHMTKSRNRKLIRVTSSNKGRKHMCVDLSDYNRYLNQIWYRTQIPHYQHARMAKFT